MSIPVHDPEHPHNAVWREYTQSLLDGKPRVVECKRPEMAVWLPAVDPWWFLNDEYRIARPMLKLSYEVPMPVTEPLEDGQEYWLAVGEMPMRSSWTNDRVDERRLRAGLIYLTEADAQAAIDAPDAARTAALEAAK